MIKTINTVAIAIACILPLVSHASSFQWDGVELSYSTIKIEEDEDQNVGEFDLDGGSIEFNYSVTPNFVAGVRYTSVSGENEEEFRFPQTAEVDIKGPEGFVFYHADHNEKTAYLIGFSYGENDTIADEGSSFSGATSETSYNKSVIGGVRYQFNQKIEFNLNLDYDVDAEEEEDELSYQVRGRYRFKEDLDLSLSAEFLDGGRGLSVSIKKYFDYSR